MSSVIIYVLTQDNIIKQYDETRNAHGYQRYIWKVLSEAWGYDDLFSWGGDKDKQIEFWGRHTDTTLPFWERLLMVSSWDCPYFDIDKLDTLINSLQRFVDTYLETDIVNTIPRTIDILQRLRNDNTEYKGFFVSSSFVSEFFSPPEIYVDVEPMDDEEYRQIIFVKKDMHLDFLKHRYNKFQDGNKVFAYQKEESNNNDR